MQIYRFAAICSTGDMTNEESKSEQPRRIPAELEKLLLPSPQLEPEAGDTDACSPGLAARKETDIVCFHQNVLAEKRDCDERPANCSRDKRA